MEVPISVFLVNWGQYTAGSLLHIGTEANYRFCCADCCDSNITIRHSMIASSMSFIAVKTIIFNEHAK